MIILRLASADQAAPQRVTDRAPLARTTAAVLGHQAAEHPHQGAGPAPAGVKGRTIFLYRPTHHGTQVRRDMAEVLRGHLGFPSDASLGERRVPGIQGRLKKFIINHRHFHGLMPKFLLYQFRYIVQGTTSPVARSGRARYGRCGAARTIMPSGVHMRPESALARPGWRFGRVDALRRFRLLI